MGWRALLDPVGPLPRSVYWLRRLAVLLPVVVVILVIVLLAARTNRPARHPADAAVTATTPAAPVTPLSSAPPSTAAPTTSAAATTCAADALSLSVRAASSTVTAGSSLPVTATLTTSGPACSAVGPLTVVVTSGSDRIWGSTDCSPESSSAATALAAHGTAAASRTWPGVRSLPGCVPVVGDRTVHPGSYRVTATWAGATSAPYDLTVQ